MTSLRRNYDQISALQIGRVPTGMVFSFVSRVALDLYNLSNLNLEIQTMYLALRSGSKIGHFVTFIPVEGILVDLVGNLTLKCCSSEYYAIGFDD